MFFSKTLVVFSLALSALAVPHTARGVNHHGLARRAAIPEPIPEPELVVASPRTSRKKRAGNGRCKPRVSSSSFVAPTSTHVSSSVLPTSTTLTSATPSTTSSSVHSTSSAIVPPKNVEASPSTTSQASSTVEPPKTTTHNDPPATTSPTTTAKPAPAPTPSSGSSSAKDPLGILTDNHSGDGTFYGTGLGACGITNTDQDLIVAVSHELFDNFPGYAGGNPNKNPVCDRKIRATYQGKSVDVTVTDRCVGCALADLDFSPTAFSQLADFAVGRIHGVTWVWI